MTNKIAEFRKKSGLSQQKLADMAGISRPYLSVLETKPEKVVSNTVMFKIADALGVSINVIFLP